MSFHTEVLISFFIGGFLLSTITYLVKYLEPALAALVWASPIILLPSVVLLWNNKVANKTIGNFVFMSIPYLILTFIWQISFIVILKKTRYLEESNGVIYAVVISIIIWILFALLFYYSNIHKYIDSNYSFEGPELTLP
jgi:hypothetical protein